MKHSNRRKGTAATELALMIGILAVVLMGTIDLSRVFYFAVNVDDASRAGAQWGIRSNGFSGDSSGIQTARRTQCERHRHGDGVVVARVPVRRQQHRGQLHIGHMHRGGAPGLRQRHNGKRFQYVVRLARVAAQHSALE